MPNPNEKPLFDVYLESIGRPIAHLQRDRMGLKLIYAGAKPDLCISVGLPDQPNIQTTEAFLWNLLPEGRNLESSAQAAGVRADDLDGLLRALGSECAGSIGIVPHGAERPKSPGTFPDDYRQISEADVARELDRLSKGEAPERKGLRMSLAGVQRKLGLHIAADGTFYEPLPGAPTTAILKIADSTGGEDYAGLVENENFCMHLAKASGLDAASTTQRKIGEHDVLIVSRFDRIQQGNKIRRLHQEDVCQALGYAAGSKYVAELVSSENLQRLIDACRNKAAARVHLFNALTFNYLVGNNDGHGKNLGLMHETPAGPSTSFSLLYDVVCTALYPKLQTTLALPIGGQVDPEDIDKQCFERLATDLGALPAFAELRIKQLVPRVYKEAKTLMKRPEFREFYAGRVVQLIAERSAKLAEEFGIEFEHEEMMFVAKPPGWSM